MADAFVLPEPAQNHVVIAVNTQEAVIAAGVQGPPGAAGQDGAGAATREITQTAAQDGAMTVALPNININAGLDVYINGVKQLRSEFTATSVLLTLPPSLQIMTGDVISAVYQL